MDESLIEIVSMVREVSPVVWSATLKQMTFTAWSDLVFAIALLASSVLTCKKGLEMKKVDTYSDNELIAVFLVMLSVVIAMMAALALQSSIGKFINPEYYAIQDIMSVIKR